MKFWAAILCVLAATGAFLNSNAVAFAETPFCAYMAETGHNVHGAFLTFYRAHNGTENFGLPLTEAFREQGRLVQYFERACFEYFPEDPGPYRVKLRMLGTQYDKTDPPIKSQAIPPANNPNFRYFSDSGQMISFTIKEYFDKSGGIDILGYPVSGLRFEAGSFVQYFQRQRLVWNPGETGPNKVRPSPVGKDALDRNYAADFKWRARMPSDWCGTPPAGPTPTAAPPVVTPTPTGSTAALTLLVRVRFRQTGLTGPQYVDVTVEDQNGRPVSNVALYAVVHSPNGERYFPLLPTNASGNSMFGFEIGNQPPNSTVTVEVFAFSSFLTASGRSSFTCQRP